MTKKRKFLSNENGEVMLEGLLVYSVTIVLLFFMVAFFALLYEQWNIQIVANDAAARIGQNYKYFAMGAATYSEDGSVIANGVGLYSGTPTGGASSVSEISMFRYWFGDKSETQAKQYAITNIPKELLKGSGAKRVSSPAVKVVVKKENLARRHVEVSITGKFKVPLGDVFAVYGFPKVIEYEKTGYAACVDISNYISSVDYVDTLFHNNLFKSSVYNFLNTIISLIDRGRLLLTR